MGWIAAAKKGVKTRRERGARERGLPLRQEKQGSECTFCCKNGVRFTYSVAFFDLVGRCEFGTRSCFADGCGVGFTSYAVIFEADPTPENARIIERNFGV